MSALLEFECASKSFPVWWRRERFVAWLTRSLARKKSELRHVIHSLSFQVNEGDIVGIVGPNGSGKSTILRMAAGIYEPDSGNVVSRTTVVPYMTPGAYFNDELSVAESVELCAALMRVPQPVRKRVDEIIERSGVDISADSQTRLLSPGMGARIAFSVLEQSGSKLLLLDEFEQSLDLEARRHCCSRIQEFAQGGGACLFASHDADIIREICSKILVFVDSRFELFDSLEQARGHTSV